MTEMNKFLEKIYKVAEFVTKVYFTNILWVVFAFPFFLSVFALAINLNSNPEIFKENFWQMITLLLILSPITIFPSSSALTHIIRKMVLKKPINSLFKEFFKGFKTNFKNSFLGGLIFSILIFILIYCVWFYGMNSLFMSGISLLFLTTTLGVSFLYTCTIVHQKVGVVEGLKSAIYLVFFNPLQTLIIIIVNFSAIMLSAKYTFLIIFFLGSFLYWNIFIRFKRIINELEKAKNIKKEMT